MKKFIISITALAMAFAIASVVSTTTAYANACTVTSFTADQTSIASGSSTTVSWTTSGCDTVSITPAQNPDNRPPSASTSTGPLTVTTTFTATGYTDYDGAGTSRSLTITVANSNGTGGTGTGTTITQCTPTSFTAQESTVDSGDGTVLHWDSTGCDSASIVPADYAGDRAPYGSVSTGAIFASSEYTLTVYDAAGNIGGQRFLTINVRNHDSNPNTNDTSCQVNSFSASPTSIDRGSNSTLQWNTSGNVNYVTISGLSGNRNGSGSVSVSPYGTTTYTLQANCNNGNTQNRTVTVYVNNNVQQSAAPQAITTVATVLNGAQARLNGIAVPNSSYGNTTAWFEWGISGAFGNRTNAQNVASGNSSQYYSDIVSGLVPGGTYFYRAVVQNQNGIAYGDIVRFQTPHVTPSPQVIVHTVKTVAHNVVVAQSAPSLLELRVESNYDRMCVNGQIDYTITYHNISSKILENTVLQFNHPKEITYLASSRGNYEVVDRTMTIDLGTVQPGEEGTIMVHARVNDTAISGNLTVATATVVYTNASTHAQEDAIAYSLITVSNDCPSLVGASVVGFGSFLPNTLLGWLLLILVILALIVLVRHVSKKEYSIKLTARL